MNKKTVRDVDLKGKRVLMRADYNVPIKDGVIIDDYRIKQSLLTIQYILSQESASLVIISHLGRPKSPADKDCTLAPVAKRLTKLLGADVAFAGDCIGELAEQASNRLNPGGVLLLENVRFHKEEEKNNPEFAKAIVVATGAKVFVQDGFGVVHRAHATTEAITKLLPSVAGLLLQKEVDTITKVMEQPEHPLVAVVGGAKVSDKIDILRRLIAIADCVAVVGAMANNFLKAEGVNIGKSIYEPEVLDTTRDILETARKTEASRQFNFLVPVDVVVSKALDGSALTREVDLASHSLSDIEAYPKMPPVPAYTVAPDELILDIGPISAAYIGGAVKNSKTVIWNGTCGVTETKGIAGAHDPFAHGTRIVVDAMIGASRRHQGPFTLVGGGDTVSYMETQGLVGDFSHVSTGGGASLDLMSGKTLPGVEALLDKSASEPATQMPEPRRL
ncbi:phosphoglycerate kinase [Candidatus Saccharibacteria bacterium CG10_big_fil_rev_8_21_14_0_10_47_8]|nr:MAG: phosphoglycerate kinase [Candidatus Saccharibacteria bacterium CG10_big_fil_rev_8_21_14_0_10_47_8]